MASVSINKPPLTLKDIKTSAPESAKSLPASLAKKAQKELNEDAEFRDLRIEETIINLKDLSDRPIPSQTCLLAFLRVSKFQPDVAAKRIHNYQNFALENLHLFNRTHASDFLSQWEAGSLGVLPSRNTEGSFVFLVDIKNMLALLKQVGQVEYLRNLFYTIGQIINSETTQVNGAIILINFHNISLPFVLRGIGQNTLQLLMNWAFNSFPLRLKGMYLINEPFSLAFSQFLLANPLMSPKVSQRIHCYDKNASYMLYEAGLKTSQVPPAFGGKNKDYEPTWWIQHLIRKEERGNAASSFLDDLLPR